MKQKKKLTAIFVVFGVIVGMILLFNSLGGEVSKSSELAQEIKRLELEIEKLETRNSAILDLSKQLDDIESLESEARIKMGMRMPGEEVVVINRPTSTSKAAIPVGDEGASIWENLGKWYKYFFDKR